MQALEKGLTTSPFNTQSSFQHITLDIFILTGT